MFLKAIHRSTARGCDMAKQIFYSVRRRDFMYLQGIEPNEKYKAGSKAPTMGTPHISADYRSVWGNKEKRFEPLTLANYLKVIFEEYRWEDRLPDDLAILCHNKWEENNAD